MRHTSILTTMSSRRWLVGWSAGGAVVIVAAGLLLELIALGRRIRRQAQEIEAAIDAARENTDALFDVTRTNSALERMVEALRR
jgi:hypothetical protein